MDKRIQIIETELQELKSAIEKITPTDEMWLFGSQVTGKQKEWSDIDIAVVSYQEKENYLKTRDAILRLGIRINDNFEIHLFSPDEFANPYDTLVSEIKRYGIKI